MGMKQKVAMKIGVYNLYGLKDGITNILSINIKKGYLRKIRKSFQRH